MPDQDGYPTDEEMQKIKDWNAISDPHGLIEFLEEIWHWPDWGIIKKKGRTKILKKPCIRVYLSTGGWSGNESIIDALKSNCFWLMFWLNSHRGGHYAFEIPLDWRKK